MPPAPRTKSRATASRSRTTSPATTEGTEADGLPTFSPPPQRSPSDALPTTATVTTDPYAGDAAGFEPEDPSTPDLSTRASTEPVKVDKLALVAAIAKLVGVVGLALHHQLAPKDIPNDLWIADEEDQVDIAEPVGSIVARRNPVIGAATDLGDGIAAAFAVAGYVMKNMAKRRELKAARTAVWEQQNEQSAGAQE